MAEEKNVNLDTKNEELDELDKLDTGELEETDDPAVLEERNKDLVDKNKQLFARAKKGEGFEQVDGKWVKKEEKPTDPKPDPKPKKEEADAGLSEEDVDSRVTATLEKRDLDNLDLSDNLRKEVESYTKLHSVSVNKALDSSYIKFVRAQEESEDNTDNASLSGGGSAIAKTETGAPEQGFDLTTDKGKEDLKKWEEKVRKDLG